MQRVPNFDNLEKRLTSVKAQWHIISIGRFMFLLSTILYFGESPAGYDIYREEEGFSLRPGPHTRTETERPLLYAYPSGISWDVQGTDDADVKEQVIRLLTIQPSVDLNQKLSAAS
jgi:hypothetical protein